MRSPSLPSVSVITATRNRVDHLSRALESIASQTLTDFECIIVDDGSSPAARSDERALIARYGPRFQLMTGTPDDSPPSGPAAAKNRGLAAATGEFLAFLDDDDLWIKPDYLAIAVHSLRDRRADFLFADAQCARQGEVVIRSLFADAPALFRGASVSKLAPVFEVNIDTFAHVMRRKLVHPNYLVVRRELLQAVGPLSERQLFAEDFEWTMRLADAARRVLYMAEIVVEGSLPEIGSHSLTQSQRNQRLAWVSAGTQLRTVAKNGSMRAAARSREAWELRALANDLGELGRADEALAFARQAAATFPTLGAIRDVGRRVFRRPESASAGSHLSSAVNPLRTDALDFDVRAQQVDVSVVIGTRNRPELLARALESVLAQENVTLDVIVADDSSDPQHSDAYRHLSMTADPRVRFLMADHPCEERHPRGPGATRNRGLRAARGEFVAFLDDDDWWVVKDHLAVAVAALRSSGVHFYFANRLGVRDRQIVMPDGFPASPQLTAGPTLHNLPVHQVSPPAFEKTMRHHLVHMDTLVVRRDLVIEAGGVLEQIRYGEDYEFTMRLADASNGFVYRPDVVVHCRMPEGNSVSLQHSSVEQELSMLIATRHLRAVCTKPGLRRIVRAREGWHLRRLAAALQQHPQPAVAMSFGWQAIATFPTAGAAFDLLAALPRRIYSRRHTS